MDGFEVKKLENVVSKADIVVTATGNKDIVNQSSFMMMKDKTIVCNIGHFDNEIDMDWLESNFGSQKTTIKPQVDSYRINKDFKIDPKNGRINDRKAKKMWSREYEKGWSINNIS